MVEMALENFEDIEDYKLYWRVFAYYRARLVESFGEIIPCPKCPESQNAPNMNPFASVSNLSYDLKFLHLEMPRFESEHLEKLQTLVDFDSFQVIPVLNNVNLFVILTINVSNELKEELRKNESD